MPALGETARSMTLPAAEAAVDETLIKAAAGATIGRMIPPLGIPMPNENPQRDAGAGGPRSSRTTGSVTGSADRERRAGVSAPAPHRSLAFRDVVDARPEPPSLCVAGVLVPLYSLDWTADGRQRRIHIDDVDRVTPVEAPLGPLIMELSDSAPPSTMSVSAYPVPLADVDPTTPPPLRWDDIVGTHVTPQGRGSYRVALDALWNERPPEAVVVVIVEFSVIDGAESFVNSASWVMEVTSRDAAITSPKVARLGTHA